MHDSTTKDCCHERNKTACMHGSTVKFKSLVKSTWNNCKFVIRTICFLRDESEESSGASLLVASSMQKVHCHKAIDEHV